MEYVIPFGTANVTLKVEVSSSDVNSNGTLVSKSSLYGPVLWRDNTGLYTILRSTLTESME